MCYLQVWRLMFAAEGNPVAFPALRRSSGKISRRQRMQTTATQIFCRYPLAIHKNSFGGEIAGLIQHTRVATLTLDDDDGVGIGETFQVYPHGTPANTYKLGP